MRSRHEVALALAHALRARHAAGAPPRMPRPGFLAPILEEEDEKAVIAAARHVSLGPAPIPASTVFRRAPGAARYGMDEKAVGPARPGRRVAWPDVAILTRLDSAGSGPPRQIFWGAAISTMQHPRSTETAIVNLLQSASVHGAKLTNGEIYCTCRPTRACIGMMRLAEIRTVYYWQAGKVVSINTGSGAVVEPDEKAGVEVELEGLEKSTRPDRRIAVDGAGWLNIPDGMPRALAALRWLEAMEAAPAGPGGAGGAAAAAAAVAAAPAAGPALLRTYAEWRLGAGAGGLWQGVPSPRMSGVPAGFPFAGLRQEFLDELFMNLAFVIAARNWHSDRLSLRRLRLATPEGGHNIACVIATSDGRILAWGINRKDVHSLFHGETSAIQAFGREMPPNATLYTTLEPCFMCAGMFAHAGGQRCIYAQVDQGMEGRTALATIEQVSTAVFGSRAPARTSGSSGGSTPATAAAAAASGSSAAIPGGLARDRTQPQRGSLLRATSTAAASSGDDSKRPMPMQLVAVRPASLMAVAPRVRVSSGEAQPRHGSLRRVTPPVSAAAAAASSGGDSKRLMPPRPIVTGPAVSMADALREGHTALTERKKSEITDKKLLDNKVAMAKFRTQATEFLQSPAAADIFRYAEERLVNTARRAASANEQRVCEAIWRFLRTGHLGVIGRLAHRTEDGAREL